MGATTTNLQLDQILQLQTLLASLQTMVAQQFVPLVHPAEASALRPQFMMSNFPSLSFPSNMVFEDGTFCREFPIAVQTSMHDLVNQTLT